MSLVALGLVLTAAILHAGWNLGVKLAKQKQVFMWWAIVIGTLCFLVAPLLYPSFLLQAWPYIISSAVAEAVYFIALTWAYDIDDFSLVYPLARGAAPVLLIIWTALFLNESPEPMGLVGIIVLVLGLIIVGSGSFWTRIRSTTLSVKGIVAALITASCISIYTAIDGAAVRLVSPISYIALVFALTAVFTCPVMLFRYGPREVLAEWQVNWRRIILVGLVMMLTYVLVLYAYSLARVSYAGAVREVSIVFATLAGWLWLGEGFGVARTIGAILIFIGIMVIAVLG